MDTHGLIGEAGDVLKHTDDLAFAAKTSGKNADEVVSATAKKSKSLIDEDQLLVTRHLEIGRASCRERV